MKIRLEDILKSTILLEGRREEVISKFGEESTELVDYFVDLDPSGNNKYLEWMVKQVLDGGNDRQDVVGVITDFHEQINGIKNKDINSYKTLDSLRIVVDEVLEKKKQKLVAKQAKKIFDSDDVFVFSPFTHEAACKYGIHSKWCIATSNANFFNDNYGNDLFYMFLHKKKTKDSDPVGFKYALQVKNGDLNNSTWWDGTDHPHSTPPSWVTSEMMDAVKEFNPSHKKIKYKAKAQAFVDSPRIEDYSKFSDIITQEERDSVINKLIKDKQLTFNYFNILRNDLSEEQHRKFFNKLVSGVNPMTINDYINFIPHLTKEMKLDILNNNPSLLNSSEFINDIDNSFPHEKKHELSKKIDLKGITNSESKVLLKKWSMTPQQLADHMKYSFYVFLSSENQYVKNLMKVDPLDSQTYKKINMLKLERNLNKEFNLYGIKTDSDYLDPYLDKNGQIPENVIEYMKSKATKVPV